MSLDAARELVDDHAELDRIMGEGERAFTAGDADLALERLDLLWARLAVHIRAEHNVTDSSFHSPHRDQFTTMKPRTRALL